MKTVGFYVIRPNYKRIFPPGLGTLCSINRVENKLHLQVKTNPAITIRTQHWRYRPFEK